MAFGCLFDCFLFVCCRFFVHCRILLESTKNRLTYVFSLFFTFVVKNNIILSPPPPPPPPPPPHSFIRSDSKSPLVERSRAGSAGKPGKEMPTSPSARRRLAKRLSGFFSSSNSSSANGPDDASATGGSDTGSGANSVVFDTPPSRSAPRVTRSPLARGSSELRFVRDTNVADSLNEPPLVVRRLLRREAEAELRNVATGAWLLRRTSVEGCIALAMRSSHTKGLFLLFLCCFD